jgi:glycosyltransferase involved in cell wall biosynthesis
MSSTLRMPERVRLLFVVTTGNTASLLMKGQLAHLAAQGFHVTVVGAPDDHLQDLADREGVEIVPLVMSRSIDPVSDAWALWKLFWLMRRIRPHVVNASTPKAGMLGMLAARMAGVPVRVYTLDGLRMATTRGVRRRLLAAAERLAARCSHRVWSVSRSLGREFAELGLAAVDKIDVLGHGSSNGVDAAALAPTPQRRSRGRQLRRELGIPPDAPVLGFVGPLTRDKGIADLVRAFDELPGKHRDARLLCVGDWEPHDAVDAETRAAVRDNPRVICTGFVRNVFDYHHVMDALVFPSHREGFPNAVLEAQAAGLPVAGYAVTGVVDAVVDGETGLLAPPGDVAALGQCVAAYLDDPAICARHGQQGRLRAARDFARSAVWNLQVREYERLLAAKGIEIRLTQRQLAAAA